MRSKPEVYLHHTPYFHMEMLAIILELFSILYSQFFNAAIILRIIPAQLSQA